MWNPWSHRQRGKIYRCKPTAKRLGKHKAFPHRVALLRCKHRSGCKQSGLWAFLHQRDSVNTLQSKCPHQCHPVLPNFQWNSTWSLGWYSPWILDVLPQWDLQMLLGSGVDHPFGIWGEQSQRVVLGASLLKSFIFSSKSVSFCSHTCKVPTTAASRGCACCLPCQSALTQSWRSRQVCFRPSDGFNEISSWEAGIRRKR